MIYKQQEPSTTLKSLIKSFWLIDSEDDASTYTQKIIPDGYPELIFHYKAPFKANISGSWFLQDKHLVAGQIRNHFFLKNEGHIGMLGIKLQPWALRLLFNLDMSALTDKVFAVEDLKLSQLDSITKIAKQDTTFEHRIAAIEEQFETLIDLHTHTESLGQQAAQYIINCKGEITMQAVIDKIGIYERSLERYFKTHIGLSPKLYSRIIRFSNIFKLVQKADFNWSDVTYLAGFYDQSHFIKNFKEFTGEEPSNYGFNDQNMANFFLK